MSKTFFYIRNSKLTNPKAVNRLLDPEDRGHVSLKDGVYTMEVLPEGRRSLPQNSRFHAILPHITKALQNLGWEEIREDEDTKKFLKGKFLTRHITHHETGETVSYVQDTRNLTVAEFSRFMDGIDRFCAQELQITTEKKGNEYYIINQNNEKIILFEQQ